MEVWLAYVLATTVLLFVPGPVVFLAISTALQSRRKAGLLIAGAVLGDFTAMTLALVGVGVVVTQSGILFTVLKLFGAAYLVWLGIGLWQASKVPFIEEAAQPTISGIATGFFATALHPAGYVFFISFVPQFVDPTRPVFPQFALLEATFIILAFLNLVFWVLVGDRLGGQLRSGPWIGRLQKFGGFILIIFGGLTAIATGSFSAPGSF